MACWLNLSRRSKAFRYFQGYTILPDVNALLINSRKGLQSPCDGIIEVGWETSEDLEEGLNSPQGQEASARLVEREAHIADFSKCRVLMREEHQIP